MLHSDALSILLHCIRGRSEITASIDHALHLEKPTRLSDTMRLYAGLWINYPGVYQPQVIQPYFGIGCDIGDCVGSPYGISITPMIKYPIRGKK